MFNQELYNRMEKTVIAECGEALAAIRYDEIQAYLDAILKAEKVFFVGVGRVLLALQCIAKRYAHLGIRTVVVGEITEPAITDKDVLVVGSGSGETLFPAGIARKARTLGATVVHIGSNPRSGLWDVADVFVRIPVESRAKAEDEIHSKQPMTSLFEQSLLLFGDTTAMMMVEDRGIDVGKLWQYHANLE